MSLCHDVRSQLPLFVGGDLEAGRSSLVREHLRDCPTCRREAAGLQQPLKHLRRLAATPVDEAVFESLHDEILERVAAEVGAERSPVGARRMWLAATVAAASFVIGWWLVRPAALPDALDRPPIGTSVRYTGPVQVVPYAGERVPLRSLGAEEWSGNGPGSGMLERWRLRSLVEEPALPGVDAEDAARTDRRAPR